MISLILQCNNSTISWSRPPVPLWDVLDLHQVALPLVCLLVSLPFVVITIRILDAFLRAVRHRFHFLQFLNHTKDRNCILCGTLFWCRCCCCCSCRCWWRCCGRWRDDSRAFATTVFPMTATRHMNAILVHKSGAPGVLVAIDGGATHVFHFHECEREDTVATGTVA